MSPPINIDGSSVSSVTIDGTSVSEVTVDGEAVFSAIPDAVASLYEYEGDSDTSVAIDSVGSNDASISGATYSTDAVVGSLSLDHADGDSTEQNSAVDYVSQGTEEAVGLSVWVKPESEVTDQFYSAAEWGPNNDNFLRVYENSGSWNVNIQVSNNSVETSSGVSLDSSTHTHLVPYATQSEIGLWVDNTLETTKSHSLDITNIGAGRVRTGVTPAGPSNYVGLIDDLAPMDAEPNESDVDALYNRA